MTQSERPAIAAAIIVDEGRVLMVRRNVKEGSLSWQFPAGEVEPGETNEQAAAREAEEETGVTVRPTQLLGERVHPNTGRSCSTSRAISSAAPHTSATRKSWRRWRGATAPPSPNTCPTRYSSRCKSTSTASCANEAPYAASSRSASRDRTTPSWK